jgi:hypothetical protein
MNSEHDPALAAYLELDDEALLEELGVTLLGEGPGFGPSDIERSMRFARDWLDQRGPEFRERLCGDVRLRLERDGGMDKLADAAAVADALQAILGKPTVYLAAIIIARRGLGKLCGQTS